MDGFCFSSSQLEEIRITLKTGLEEEDLLQNPLSDFDNFFDE